MTRESPESIELEGSKAPAELLGELGVSSFETQESSLPAEFEGGFDPVPQDEILAELRKNPDLIGNNVGEEAVN